MIERSISLHDQLMNTASHGRVTIRLCYTLTTVLGVCRTLSCICGEPSASEEEPKASTGASSSCEGDLHHIATLRRHPTQESLFCCQERSICAAHTAFHDSRLEYCDKASLQTASDQRWSRVVARANTRGETRTCGPLCAGKCSKEPLGWTLVLRQRHLAPR